VINAFIVKKFTNLAVAISTSAIFVSFLYALRIFLDFLNVYSVGYHIHKTFTWFDLGSAATTFKMGIYIDNMTSVMLLMVTGAATLIHVFSTWYMHDDARFGRFLFTYHSLLLPC